MTLFDKVYTLITVRALKEQDSIVLLIEEIKITGFPFVVINDRSTDETQNRALSAGERTIVLPNSAGLGWSLKCVFQHAVADGYAAVIQCDADGQHPTKDFESFANHASVHSSQLVIGSRFSGDDATMHVSRLHKLAMKMISSVIKRTNQVEVTDITSGLRLVSRLLLGQYAQRYPLAAIQRVPLRH